MEIDYTRVHWKSGYRPKASAADALAVVQAINERDGHVTPKAVVVEATPEESPIHPQFEWNDPLAAHMYREDQARKMLQAIVVPLIVEKRDAPAEEIVIRVLQVENGDHEDRPARHYSFVQDILEDEDRTTNLLTSMRREMQAAADKYRVYSKIADLPHVRKVIEAVDDFTAACT